MPRERREHRLRGRYRLRRIRDDYIDEEDGNETVIEYSTGTDTDDEEEMPRGKAFDEPRGTRCCRTSMTKPDRWRSIRDLIIVGIIVWWFIRNLTDTQKEKLATWQSWWDTKAVPTVRNITTESVATLRRFHNHRAPHQNHTDYFQPGRPSPVA